jgi:hypothetical protein
LGQLDCSLKVLQSRPSRGDLQFRCPVDGTMGLDESARGRRKTISISGQIPIRASERAIKLSVTCTCTCARTATTKPVTTPVCVPKEPMTNSPHCARLSVWVSSRQPSSPHPPTTQRRTGGVGLRCDARGPGCQKPRSERATRRVSDAQRRRRCSDQVGLGLDGRSSQKTRRCECRS